MNAPSSPHPIWRTFPADLRLSRGAAAAAQARGQRTRISARSGKRGSSKKRSAVIHKSLAAGAAFERTPRPRFASLVLLGCSALPRSEADHTPGVRSWRRRPAGQSGAYALCVVSWRRGPGGSPLSLHRQPARLSCEERTVALLGPCCCAGPVVRQPRVAAASRAKAPESCRSRPIASAVLRQEGENGLLERAIADGLHMIAAGDL